jgi:8-oxo-dGTP pyrophosphatase MutT (NUDIX family)
LPSVNSHPVTKVYNLEVEDDHTFFVSGFLVHNCGPCVARDGKTFSLKTLPGWPGDGGFGGDICRGGPNCHCSTRFVQNGQTLATGTNTQLPGATSYYQQQLATITGARQQAAAARESFTASLPPGPSIRAATRDQLRQMVADLANARIRAAGGYPGVSVEPQDVPAQIIAQMLPPGMEGAAGLTTPQVNVAEAVRQMFAAKSAVLDMTKAEFTSIILGVLADVAKTVTGPPADPQAVYDQLARNYEPQGIAWVLDIPWTGPVDVPLDQVHDGSEDSWAASEPGSNTGHVSRFAGRIDAGEGVNPVVMVKVPGHAKLRVVDGHHRYLGYRELGRPVKAYVGLVDDDSPQAPWALTHLYQVHSGGDPLNKQAGDEDPSRVAFLLMRAPNGNGKWRYLLQKRDDQAPHGGTWGLPGGKAHEGEAPWDAAVREAREELGDLPGVKAAAVWSRAEDDHVVFTYLVNLPRMFTPSADGETSGETAGWGWFRKRDVADLNLHPAMRETWERLDFGEPLLGGEAPDAVKAASGYDLNPRSGMISLDLPEGLIEPVPGGISDHHITIVYCGPDVDDEAFANACERAAAAAAAMPGPLSGVISGRGTFEPSGSSDGKIVAWAGVTLPGAEQLRATLEDLSASEFSQWSPHVTLAYQEPYDALPGPVPVTPVTFTHVSVHRGDEVARFPLGAD